MSLAATRHRPSVCRTRRSLENADKIKRNDKAQEREQRPEEQHDLARVAHPAISRILGDGTSHDI